MVHSERRALYRLLMILLTALIVFAMCVSTSDALSSGEASGKITAKEGAFIRASASTSSNKIGSLKYNSSVVIKGEVFTTKSSTKSKNKWFKVSYNGKEGYIRADLVGSLSYNPVSGTITKKAYYRAGAGTKMKKKGTIKKGKSVTVLMQAKAKGSSTVWYKVKIGSKIRYISSNNVKLAAQSGTASTAPVSTAATVNYSGPVEFSYTDLKYPITTYTGVPYILRGKVNCTWPITQARVGIKTLTGSWVTMAERTGGTSTQFDIASVDSDIKFGNLLQGAYYYTGEFCANDKWITVFNYRFNVEESTGGTMITNEAISLAWPMGTASSIYAFNGGCATDAFNTVFDRVYPTHFTWGKGPRTGACCDVFVGTVIRGSGYDTSMPRGETEMWSYFPNSDKWIQVAYSGKESELRSGDVILYKRTDGGQHVLLYIKINGKGVIAEAAYQKSYGHINTSLSKIQKWSNKTKMVVYRPTS